MATKKPNIKITADSVAEVRDMLALLSKTEVLVGYPDSTANRDPNQVVAGQDPDITNAALAYIHDNGAPEQNIPARPFMIPGMDNAREPVIRQLVWTAKQVLLRSGAAALAQGFARVGLTVQASIRKKINEGVPPPLSEWTLRERARRGRKGAKEELANRALGLPSSTALAKPLIDTGQLRNAVNYVIRPRKQRK